MKEEFSNKTIDMKTLKLKSKLNFLIILSILIMLGSCRGMSDRIEDKSAGMNGGFEVSENGIPVNWLIYSPNTLKDADFKIVLDTVIYKEGKQSLRFDIVKCSSRGGSASPGIHSEFFTSGQYEGPATYKLSFWVKNEGSTFKIFAGGVEAMGGDSKVNSKSINEIHDEQISDWKLLEYHIDVPKDRWLRMELNILKPGTFWIDDIQIEKE
jgi:hypothetical protein